MRLPRRTENKIAHYVCAFLLMCNIIVGTIAYAAHQGDGALDDVGHVTFLERNLFENWTGAAMMMAEQLATLMMYQINSVGLMMDAGVFLRTQQLYQELSAEAHRDYHPSVQMCALTTNIRSLNASDALSKANARMFNEILLTRDVNQRDSSGAQGQATDYDIRREQFIAFYCDPKENNNEIEAICNGGSNQTARITRDIDFHRLMDSRYTLDVDFTDPSITADEQDILALGKNLFSHEIFFPIPAELVNQQQARNDFAEMRSVNAIRSVARNSFSNLVGMKAKGSPEVAEYMREIIKELGVETKSMSEDDAIDEFLGKSPSYFAQMEVLTSKLYQSPSFYINLYDKPNNVKRTRVALKAFDIMQNRDRFESALRREMLVSLILETKLRKHQEKLNDTLKSMLPQDVDKLFPP